MSKSAIYLLSLSDCFLLPNQLMLKRVTIAYVLPCAGILSFSRLILAIIARLLIKKFLI